MNSGARGIALASRGIANRQQCEQAVGVEDLRRPRAGESGTADAAHEGSDRTAALHWDTDGIQYWRYVNTVGTMGTYHGPRPVIPPGEARSDPGEPHRGGCGTVCG